MNVCVIGTGYVGLVTGASLAYMGHEVTCVDIDAEKISKLKVGTSPIYEPGLDELLETGLRRGHLSFTTDLNRAMMSSEIIFIAVGTPPLPDGSPDLSFLKAAAQDIGRGIVLNHKSDLFRIIINKSTVPVGCGNWVEMLIREQIRSMIKEGTFEGNGHEQLSPAAFRPPPPTYTDCRRSGRTKCTVLIGKNIHQRWRPSGSNSGTQRKWKWQRQTVATRPSTIAG